MKVIAKNFGADETDYIRPETNLKCPIDNRKRPIYITVNGRTVLAMADGKGHAYKVYGEGYDVYESRCLPNLKYDPSKYEFKRGLSGMDF